MLQQVLRGARERFAIWNDVPKPYSSKCTHVQDIG